MSIRKRWLLTATFIVTFVSFAVTFGCAPALNVRPKQPFQQRVELILPENTGGQNGFVNVPAGKRLVIEYISGEAFMPQGQKMLFSVICWVSGKKARHYLWNAGRP